MFRFGAASTRLQSQVVHIQCPKDAFQGALGGVAPLIHLSILKVPAAEDGQ